jgi:hypothetical protein
VFIRQRRREYHTRYVGAFTRSLAAVTTKSPCAGILAGAEGWVRGLYYGILFSHIVLAAVIALALVTISRALREQITARARLRPVMYVSVTGGDHLCSPLVSRRCSGRSGVAGIRSLPPGDAELRTPCPSRLLSSTSIPVHQVIARASASATCINDPAQTQRRRNCWNPRGLSCRRSVERVRWDAPLPDRADRKLG